MNRYNEQLSFEQSENRLGMESVVEYIFENFYKELGKPCLDRDEFEKISCLVDDVYRETARHMIIDSFIEGYKEKPNSMDNHKDWIDWYGETFGSSNVVALLRDLDETTKLVSRKEHSDESRD